MRRSASRKCNVGGRATPCDAHRARCDVQHAMQCATHNALCKEQSCRAAQTRKQAMNALGRAGPTPAGVRRVLVRMQRLLPDNVRLHNVVGGGAGVHAVSVVVLVGVPDAGRHRAALKSPDYLCRWPKSLCLPQVALGEARAGICAGTLAQTLDGRVLARSGAMCVPPTLRLFRNVQKPSRTTESFKRFREVTSGGDCAQHVANRTLSAMHF